MFKVYTTNKLSSI